LALWINGSGGAMVEEWLEISEKAAEVYLVTYTCTLFVFKIEYWYFGTVPIVWYFGTVPTVWYSRTVPTVWYFLFFIL
jgi:hypothetical protein